MLLDKIKGAPGGRRIALRIGNGGLRAVLAELLREWHYQVVDDGPRDLLLADAGVVPPAGAAPVLRLGAGGDLDFPLSLEDLWRELETRVHTPPRRYLRIALPLDVEVRRHGRSEICRLVSLSSMGARFEYPREVIGEEYLELRLQIGGAPMVIATRVIYAIPQGEWLKNPGVHAGVVFDRQQGVQDALRTFIVSNYLERVRRCLSEGVFREGAAFFQPQPEAGP